MPTTSTNTGTLPQPEIHSRADLHSGNHDQILHFSAFLYGIIEISNLKLLHTKDKTSAVDEFHSALLEIH